MDLPNPSAPSLEELTPPSSVEREDICEMCDGGHVKWVGCQVGWMGEIYDHVFETRGDVVTYFDDDDHRDAYIAQKTREEEAKYERRKESYYSCLKAAKEEQQRLAKLASEESLTGLTTDNSTPGLKPSNAGETSTLQPCSNHSTDLEEKIHLPK